MEEKENKVVLHKRRTHNGELSIELTKSFQFRLVLEKRRSCHDVNDMEGKDEV